MTDKTDLALPLKCPMTDDALGLTAQEHAAIQLRVPMSGTEWLDEMIRKRNRMDYAQAALHGIAADPNMADLTADDIARFAYKLVNAMIREGEKE